MKKMSKILSIILAISMVISMIPMSFAAEGEMEAADAGVTITYPLIQKAYEAYKSTIPGKETSVLFSCEITYSHSGGRLQWHSTTSTITPQPGWGRGSASVQFSSVASTVEGETVYNPSDEYAAWTIRVPKSGKYDISTIYGTSSAGTEGAMYLLPGDTKDIANAVKKEEPVITVDFYDENVNTSYEDFNKYNNPNSTSGTAANVGVSDISNRYLDAGEYIVVWMGYGNKVSTASGTIGRYVLRPATLTLDGNGTNRAHIYADITGTKTELDAGIEEETNVVLNSVYMSDGVAATDSEKATITYESSDPEVATVTGSTIKAVSEGNATIYAKNGDYILGEVDITVNDTAEAGVKVVYPFSSKIAGVIYALDAAAGTAGQEKQSIRGLKYTTDQSCGRAQWHSQKQNTNLLASISSYALAIHTVYLENDIQYAACEIYVPAAGKYDVKQQYATSSAGTKNNMYILDLNTNDISSALKTATPVLSVDCRGTTAAVDNSLITKGTAPYALGKWTAPAPGKYIVVWTGSGNLDDRNTDNRWSAFLGDLILDGGDGAAITGGKLVADDSTITKGSSTNLAVAGYLSTTGAALNSFTYTSSNSAVATVDSSTGVVTAVSGGVAKITATCAEAIEGYNSISTLIAVDEPTTSVSFGADASVDGIEIETNVSGYEQGKVGSVDINTPVEVKAIPTVKVADTTYVFRGWVRGNADGGRIISLDATYGFTAMTNTYLTAIYTEEAEEEYYAWNGEFLGTSNVTAPTVLGYNFKEWAKHVMSENLTRFVAQYEQLTTTYGVTYNGNVTQHKYDDPVTLTSDTDVYWYRDGKLVDYGTSYTFNVWDATEITTSSEGHNLPMLVLDAKAKDGNYMVEYDANGKTIIEVGILFNAEDDNAPTVESCKEKMNSQRDLSKNPHGQFAAKAGTYTQARGYLIYQDGGEYKVIYSE